MFVINNIFPIFRIPLHMSNLVQNSEVAIILCTYNRPGMLQRAIESILDQEYTNYRIIIIDDGSDENVRKQNTEFVKDTIKKSKTDFPRIEYYQHPENRGTVSTRNEGVVRALNSGAKYICFLDDDDLWHKKRLLLGVNAMESDYKIGMSYGIQVTLNETLDKVLWQSNCNISFRKAIVQGLLIRDIFFPSLTILYDREFLKELSLGKNKWFSEMEACEDLDLVLRALFYAKKSQWNVKYIHTEEPLAYYVRSSDSLSSKENNAKFCRNASQYILSQYVWKPIVIIIPIVYIALKKPIPRRIRKGIKKLLFKNKLLNKD